MYDYGAFDKAASEYRALTERINSLRENIRFLVSHPPSDFWKWRSIETDRLEGRQDGLIRHSLPIKTTEIRAYLYDPKLDENGRPKVDILHMLSPLRIIASDDIDEFSVDEGRGIDLSEMATNDRGYFVAQDGELLTPSFVGCSRISPNSFEIEVSFKPAMLDTIEEIQLVQTSLAAMISKITAENQKLEPLAKAIKPLAGLRFHR